mmetsp:Transcript_107646/g.150117  ORF Transcript_107646/g.150117 Transcript_107646/m.150117 type:complete len:344 (+) Transcript_107646:217-1248(+)
MAPAKREWEDMMFDADPVYEIDVILGGHAPRAAKRVKDFHPDLSTYLVPSDDEFDAVPSEVLELEVQTDAFQSPFIGGSSKASFEMPITSTESFHDLGDLSSSDDDNGYATMFNSPAHVLDAEYDVPFIDGITSAADALLVEPTESTMEEVVRALSAPSSPTPVLERPPVVTTEHTMPPAPKDGKPPVNPTRWAHNSTERKRRLEIRKLFSGLRDLFPDIAGDDKISNITTLNRAIEQVAELKSSISERETSLVALRERNAVLKARAEECAALRKSWQSRQLEALADVPPTAAAVLEGNPDPALRKQLPAALRQLLDHNSRGAVEQKPLSRRRKGAPTTIVGI